MVWYPEKDFFYTERRSHKKEFKQNNSLSQHTGSTQVHKKELAKESDARQRKERQGRARREGGDREVARRLQRESERECEESEIGRGGRPRVGDG